MAVTELASGSTLGSDGFGSEAFAPTLEQAILRIRARNESLCAFVTTRLDAAVREHRRLSGEPARSPLHGVPYSLKDMWDTVGIRTTAGSHRYRDRVPAVSSPVHVVFEEAGAILVGKTNSSDVGMAGESASFVGGVTKNPCDPSRTAGGSSGGAAAAVADKMVAFDWGSDFGGSIRVPAAYCGVFGMRLSSEAWPVVGMFPSPPPSLRYLNGQGPIAPSLATMRGVLRVAAPRLRTGAVRPFSLSGGMIYAPTGREQGRWPTFAADIRAPLARAVGSVRDDHGLPALERAARFIQALWSSHLEDLASVDPSGTSIPRGLLAVMASLLFRGSFGTRHFHPRTAEVLALLGLGRISLFRDRQVAARDAEIYRSDVAALWDRGYVIALPTSCFPAPRHGRSVLNWSLHTCAMPGNVADATGLAVPFGRFSDGLPRSFQLWGPPGSEETLIDVAERMLLGP